MSEEGDDDRSSQNEGEEGQEADPEIWRYAAEDKVGKIVRLLTEKDGEDGEEGDLQEAVKERNPQTGQSLLLWAVLHERFVLVEWLVKKCGREALAFRNARELQVYDQWVTERKEKEERDRERALQMEEEEEPMEEDEEQEEPEEMWSLVLKACEDTEGIDEFMVRRIGELGVYEGGRDPQNNKHGVGQALFANGDMYIGEYCNNKRSGLGCYIWAADKCVYTGEWKDNVRSGTGRMIYADGGKYYGAWQYDQKTGRGRYTYPNGDTFDGEWLDDRREGDGTYQSASDSAKYQGTWRNGDFTSGKWILCGGLVYYGVFRNFKPHGKGLFIFKNGRFKQEGCYKKGKWCPREMANLHPDQPPYLELEVQGKCLQLRYTPEALATLSQPEQVLVKAANFRPFERWLCAVETSRKALRVEDIKIRCVDLDNNDIVGLRLKIEAYAKGCDSKIAQDDFLLQLPTTQVLPILVHQGKELAVMMRQPRLCTGEWASLQIPSGTEYAAGDIRSASIRKVSQLLQVKFNSGTMIDLAELAFGSVGHSLITSPEQSSSSYNVWLYKQHIHADYYDRLLERLVYFNREGNLLKVELVPLEQVGNMSSDAATGAVLAMLQSLGKRTPVQTVAAQRPPTPPAPEPEPVPQYTEEEVARHKAFLEAELAAQQKKAEEQDDADGDEGEED